MRIYYFEEEGIKTFNEDRNGPILFERFAEKREKMKDPITITLHIEVDRDKYKKIKYKTSLADRIFSYFGF